MKLNPIRKLLSLALVIGCCLTLMPSVVRADDVPEVQRRGRLLPRGQQSEAQPSEQPGDGADAAREWIQSFSRIRIPSTYLRSHSTVTTAFREVVATPSKSTVRVLVGGKQAALGTIVDADGFILTKASELKGSLECQLSDGRRLRAAIVGVEPNYDLAMLKIDAKSLPCVTWADDAAPPVGSWLATPGLDNTPVSIGVVSVVPRKIEAPSGVLGILLEQDERGPRIDQVMPGSGAETAGLQVNDVVVSVNGTMVVKREALINIVQRFKPGDKIDLSILRGDKQIKITATLSSRTQLAGGDRSDFQNSLGGALSDRRTGFPSVLQHDTVLRPNECGGAIVDLDGKAVGINIARADRVSSFAIPVGGVKPLLADLKSGKLAPGPSPEEVKRALAEKIDHLKKSVETWTGRLTQLQDSLKKSQEAELAAQQAAAAAAADAAAKLAVQKAHEATEALEKAAREAQASLERTTAELKKFEADTVSLEE
jgi:serine protease Do